MSSPPPIVYGEPIYLPPPIAVAYPYDYYVYENDGGYVNIVFFSGGVRHVEMWHDHGLRMTRGHYNQWRGRSENRIHRDKFNHHRQTLEKNHGIKHPDSHYGVHPRTTKGGQPGHKVTPQTQKGHPQGHVQQPSKAPQTQKPAPAVKKTTPKKPAPQKAAAPKKATPKKKDENKKK